jgi:hypothetical protein
MEFHTRFSIQTCLFTTVFEPMSMRAMDAVALMIIVEKMSVFFHKQPRLTQRQSRRILHDQSKIYSCHKRLGEDPFAAIIYYLIRYMLCGAAKISQA